MTSPIIATEDLFYRYGDGTEALKGVTLTFQRGKRIAILGNNGAGKSTLFLHLNGILKPSSGTVLFHGKPIQYKKRDLNQLRKEIGIVFQNPDNQLFSPTVYDDIAYGPRHLLFSKENIASAVQRAMEETETLDLKSKPTHFLSLGQKKRVAIAGVLAMNPELMILDEPTAGLDGHYSKKMINLLNKIHSKGKTIVLSTHDINLAYEWADEIIILHDGKVIGNGAWEEIFFKENLLHLAHLNKPFVLETYEYLLRNNLISEREHFPRTKGELFSLLGQVDR